MASARILIVDDEPDTLEMLTIAIERGPYEVLTGKNGDEAISLTREEKPDLIILDVMMPPGIDGFDVCDILKNDPETSHIPIILLTAVATSLSKRYNSKLDRIETAADDYIEKPADPNYLFSRVETLLNKG